MVSFWPWGGSSSSPASFEKALSTLSVKISETQTQLDRVRSTSRRVKVLSTLYLSFAYLVYSIVLVLVVGWRNMGAWEWSGLAGGPLIITMTRTVLSAFFNFRIDALSTRLKDQQTERAKTIQKLKDATKYDSTLKLLEKYGGGDQAKKMKEEQSGKGGGKGEGDKQKTGQAGPPRPVVPPPTANIPRGDTRSPVPGPQGSGPSQQLPSLEPSAEFAPNAFGPGGPPPPPPPPPLPGLPGVPGVPGAAQFTHVPAGAGGIESHWYDRIFDVLLGEDETAAKNRIVLICQRCRLVNGQAPPGVKTLSEVGMWRCMACGEKNGEVDEGKRLVREVLRGRQSHGDRAVPEEEEADDEADSDGSSGEMVKIRPEEALKAEIANQLRDETRSRRRKENRACDY